MASQEHAELISTEDLASLIQSSDNLRILNASVSGDTDVLKDHATAHIPGASFFDHHIVKD